MGAVHGHRVGLEELQGRLQPLLRFSQLALPQQRPTQGQTDDPRQWLAGEPLDLAGLCRPSGECSGGLLSSTSPASSASSASSASELTTAYGWSIGDMR